jgi:serine/threonine protein kinase/ActR/RegA family two-component response regulator
MPARHTVLVVDDEEDVLYSLERSLRRDFRVLTAVGGEQAIELLQRNEVHLILTDQRMPGMAGDRFLQRARELKPDTIRILFTGYSDMQAVINAVNDGAIFRYILKPWAIDELIGVIHQGVEHYELVEERKKLMVELQEANRHLEGANAQLKEVTAQLLRSNAALLNSLSKDKQQLGQYRLLEKLHEQGGMGTVYKALHILLMKVVALKVLPADTMMNEAAIARFRREIMAAGRLEHPNIVQARDAGEVDGTHYLVMEFIEGIDLSRLLSHHGPVSIPDGCEMIRQAAVGLQHAFEHGLVHRDLKPSNLMLTQTGIVKILDLGLARLCDESSTSNPLTEPGQIMGTVNYTAPEQAFGPHPVDIRADLYSLGCTLYHLIGGRAPFNSPEYPSPMSKLLAHAQTRAVSIRDLRGEVTQKLAAVIDCLMAKSPNDRFDEPAKLVSALEGFAAGSDLSRLLQSIDIPQWHGGSPPGSTESVASGHNCR